MNIDPVIISTKRDRSKIDWAGVDTGAKIFVGLHGERAGSADAANAVAQSVAIAFRTLRVCIAVGSHGSAFPCDATRRAGTIPKHFSISWLLLIGFGLRSE